MPYSTSWMAKRNDRSTWKGSVTDALVSDTTTAVAAAASVPSSSTAMKPSCRTALMYRSRSSSVIGRKSALPGSKGVRIPNCCKTPFSGACVRNVHLVGFDVPLPGAVNQPWHRDFPSPPETRHERRLTSLAFNVTTVDTTEDMGPFEIAPGTHWEHGTEFEHEMFPPKTNYDRYESLAVRKHPQMGDISARSALTIHRGTINHSQRARPVLVLGVDAPGAGNADHHDTAVTRDYWDSLPERVRAHLGCPIVEELTPITQKHTIEGLVMGAA